MVTNKQLRELQTDKTSDKKRNGHSAAVAAARLELAMVLAEINDSDVMNRLLDELFTRSELHALVQRWRLLKKLKDGIPQRKIAKQLRASLCNITRGSQVLKQEDAVIADILKDRERFLCE